MIFAQASRLKTHLPTTTFPAVVSNYPATILAPLYQLEQSQWWSPQQILEKQFQQLGNVLSHAYNTIPFYKTRLENARIDPRQGITSEQWRKIPILVRRDFQGKEQQFLTSALPKGHGRVGEITTSGSTAEPIKIYTTELTQLFWNVFTLRDHYWHKRDFRKKLVSIRFFKGDQAQYPDGANMATWGNPVQLLHHTGPSCALDIKKTDVSDQLAWLSRQEPGYLLTYPSNALELAKLTLDRGLKFPSLQELRLIGEVVDQEVLDICAQAWNVPIVDVYSANEVGYIALQCPEHRNYHIQSENLYVEILHENGTPCAPGEVGKVVVSTLHNFAMPLIRYAIGDYAEVGEPCSCGRGLPVLDRILGRTRNMLVLPTGEKYWPILGLEELTKIAPIRQRQVVQRMLHDIEVRLTTERPLTRAEEDKLREMILSKLGYRFNLSFVYLDRIERSAGGKFEEFISKVTL
ncbi:MAG: phenylacetate--CoA ligase family protein [Gammaproteobacteria bacterium]|nr:phenylacetate--CoA ligase family protein [Gammaproteobacteria bacterium]NNJ84466.1 phenylacetate--CoA ligase family protein [Gammaproteobacteria bacterium]